MIREIFPDLFLIRPDAVAAKTPFTYLLRRAGGNILFPTKQDMSPYVAALDELGGVRHLLLGDRHHGLPVTAVLAHRFGTQLSASQTEAKALATKGVSIEDKIVSKRSFYTPDLEIIPTPGHTGGALSYLWSNAGRRFLFIGDTLVPMGGAWRYWVSKPKRPIMQRTVELLSTVEFDVILSNSFAATPIAWIQMNGAARKQMFAQLAAELAD